MPGSGPAPPRLVVVADDEPEVLDTIVEYLKLRGFGALGASNGLEALLVIRRVRPYAVVLDVMMPRLGGLEALEWIRGFDAAIAVVVVTGMEDPELHRRARELGALAVLTKPVDLEALAEMLRGREAAAPPAPPAAEGPAAGRVLVVDDEPDVRELLEELVAALGYDTRSAASGAGALTELARDRPDVILLDVSMPGMSGIDALGMIRARAPGTHVIMVSGISDDAVARRALSHGAFDYIRKPIDPAYLARSLATAMLMRESDVGG